MEVVFLTALGVGGATLIGAILGFVFKKTTHRFSDITLSFAAGVMLSAAVLGLILPSIEYGGKFGILITVAGIFAGAVCLNLLDKLVPHMHKLVGVDTEEHKNNSNLNKVLLFVIAIAIHNLPEGIAAGVGFGSGNTNNALLIAGGIALQNIPEGMVIIAPMLSSGISPKKTLLYAISTGLVEVLGTLIGYFAVSIATAILPFALAFAGGIMLYVISDEMMANADEMVTTATLLNMIGVYAVLAVIGTTIAICLLAWMSKNEGRQPLLIKAWEDRKAKEGKVISVPFVIGVVISILFMLLECICTMATDIGKIVYKFFLALGLLSLKIIISSEVHNDKELKLD